VLGKVGILDPHHASRLVVRDKTLALQDVEVVEADRRR
jgi:hypothetical protein